MMRGPYVLGAHQTRHASDLNLIEIKDLPPISESKHKAYLHLLAKEYYVTDALKFGGDFLAYEGDPSLYHAKYLVKVSEEPFDMLDVV